MKIKKQEKKKQEHYRRKKEMDIEKYNGKRTNKNYDKCLKIKEI